MRPLLILIFTCITTCSSAQEDLLPEFICWYNGQLYKPYESENYTNHLKIKSCSPSSIDTFLADGVMRTDTNRIFKIYYSPAGQKITLFDNPNRAGVSYAEYGDNVELSFNKNGYLKSKKILAEGMRGCGNYHWKETNIYHREYFYDQEGLVKIEDGKNYKTLIRYDKNGQKLAEENKYRAFDTASWMDDRYSYYYKYHNNFLTEKYTVDNLQTKRSGDSLLHFPADIENMLLRQSGFFYESVVVGIESDFLIKGVDEEKIKEFIDKRDEDDENHLAHYDEMADHFTGYSYNYKGQLIRSTVFNKRDLYSIDSFIYDSQNRLVLWSCTKDFNTDPFRWREAVQTIWRIEWDKNRIRSCSEIRYTGSDRNFAEMQAEEKSPLKIERERVYNLNYDNDGKVIFIYVKEKKWMREYNDIYLMQYERF